MRQSSPKKTGFTLIEMLVVISIMALIAGVSIANLRNGDRSKRVTIGFDSISNATSNAQNFALTSRQIFNSSCALGKAATGYIVMFTATLTIDLYGVDKCGTANPVETYALPVNTRIQANGFKLNTGAGLVPVAQLQIKFTPPFGKLTASSDSVVNSPNFTNFTGATLTIESIDGAVAKTVTVDGLSGRIGQ